jgi:hypothetical protein
MVQLLKKNEVKVITKDGECEIHLTLDINLNVGDVNIKAEDVKCESKLKEEDKSHFLVPDFSSERIQFGQKVNNNEG